MGTEFDLYNAEPSAIRYFWETRKQQLVNSLDNSNRGSVTGGKQMDGFLDLLTVACESIGVPVNNIYRRQNYVPGFFRSSKDWDFMVVSPRGRLLVLVELKSQIGSYGNNFNNRTEEAIGSATDFWTAYREQQFPTCGTPWMGYLMLIGRDRQSLKPVHNYSTHYPVLPEFESASYMDRYRILCAKLMTERLYTQTCLLWTEDCNSFGNVSEESSIERFISSLQGYLIGCRHEFDS